MAAKKSSSLFPDFKQGNKPSTRLETRYRENGYSRIAGVDEVGRGPLAGPVVAAAVVLPADLPDNSPLRRARDSKTMDQAAREALYDIIVNEAEAVGWSMCDHQEVDAMNILAASLEAMKRAIHSIEPLPDLLLVDGNQPVPCRIPSITVVKGDSLCLSIAAASIVAKVIRDRMMIELARLYPAYGFEGHKGYSCASHREAIVRHGPCPVHRRTFRGVKEYVED